MIRPILQLRPGILNRSPAFAGMGLGDGQAHLLFAGAGALLQIAPIDNEMPLTDAGKHVLGRPKSY